MIKNGILGLGLELELLVKTKQSEGRGWVRNWSNLLFFGMEKVWGQIPRRVVVVWAGKRHVIFLEASSLGEGLLGVLFTEQMPAGDELCYTQPWNCAREWINSELQSVRKAHNIYVVSGLCPWKWSSQDSGLKGSTGFREDLWMQPSWGTENASSLMK